MYSNMYEICRTTALCTFKMSHLYVYVYAGGMPWDSLYIYKDTHARNLYIKERMLIFTIFVTWPYILYI